MDNGTLFRGKMTARETRRASLWALAGAVAVVAAASLMPPQWWQVSIAVQGIGFAILIWKLARITLGSPGWLAGEPGEYDERETEERHRAMSTAYGLLSSVVILGLGFTHFLIGFG